MEDFKKIDMKIFLICPVRGVTEEEKETIKKYVSNFESAGHNVYWPFRDTDQNDEIGYRICSDNRRHISEADEIHIWWNGKSEGSVFDFGMAFMLLLFMPDKSIVLANPEMVQDTPHKSFANVLKTLYDWNNLKSK